MNFIKTEFKDLYIIEPKVFGDYRGYFFESFTQKELIKAGINLNFVQDNESKSKYGVIRGLHFQKEPYAQTKLLRVIKGKILDVVVDLRKNSSSFKKWFGIELSDENKKQLLIPKGFAHGFSVLSEEAIIMYKCDEFYNPEYDSGIRYNDPDLNIDWKILKKDEIVSEKDKSLPDLKSSGYHFSF